MLDELKNIKSATPQLREFGVTIGAILIVFGDIALWRGKSSAPYALAAGMAFLVCGLTIPGALKPLQKVWMGLGLVLGFFVSRIIISLLFYGIITPIGIIMRLCGKDILDEKIDKAAASYWREYPIKDKPKATYENQY